MTNPTQATPHHRNRSNGDYLNRLVGEALAWSRHVDDYAPLSCQAIRRKALQSLAFSVRHRLHSFAVPTKLRGVRSHQETLQALCEQETGFGTQLHLEAEEDIVAAFYDGRRLGEIAHKHSWIRPLLPFGATLHFLNVTGTERDEGYLGCNVAIGHAGLAALRREERGPGGDGEATKPPTPQTGEEDIVLWRDARGVAHANIRHVKRHSPTGMEWGYGGSGPSDLAYSILHRFAGEEVADTHYIRFKNEIVARLPREGGRIPATLIRQWISRQSA